MSLGGTPDQQKGGNSMSHIVNHPVSTWTAIIAAGFAAFSAYQEQQSTQAMAENTTNYAESFEDGHYRAIMDLRKKMDFLFTKVLELDTAVNGVPPLVTPPIVVRPPGPSQEPPPAPISDVVEAPDVVDPPEDAEDALEPEEEKPAKRRPPETQQQDGYPFAVDKDGKPVWAPVKRK